MTTGSDVRVYVDSSALIKRSVDELESDALEAELGVHLDHDALLISSSLAWIEVSRALRSRLTDASNTEAAINEAVEIAMSGIAERTITGEVVALARRTAPPVLRTLDAIHLATAVLLDSDVVITYDDRLAGACSSSGIATAAPRP